MLSSVSKSFFSQPRKRHQMRFLQKYLPRLNSVFFCRMKPSSQTVWKFFEISFMCLEKIHTHFVLQNIVYKHAICQKLYASPVPILCTRIREMYIWQVWKNECANSHTACGKWFIPSLKEYGSIYIRFTCISANSCCATNDWIRRKNGLGIF